MVDRLDDVVGPLPLGLCQLIKAYDQKARQRQAPQKPRVRPPQGRGPVDADVKEGAHHAAAGPHYRRYQQPFDKRPDV